MYAGKKRLIIPLGLYFMQHPYKFFPIAAITGCTQLTIIPFSQPNNHLLSA